MNDSNQTEYLVPGDLVTFNKELPNAPVMIVVRKEMGILKDQKGFKGIRCRWFTTDHTL